MIFGIEADVLDEKGNCCFDIQGIESDFCILSCHRGIYEGKFENITQAYINAIHKYHDKIKCIGHICKKNTSKYLDVDMFAKVLNQYQIPIELNCCNLYTDKTDKEKLNRLLPMIETGIYINSDMHTLHELDIKKIGFDYLKDILKRQKINEM
ncbi:MAG: hypothetical protein NT085_03220 [candidate division SR1 bacterium]|nr:hypothetical protein [candidate division SR1 bacterium]